MDGFPSRNRRVAAASAGRSLVAAGMMCLLASVSRAATAQEGVQHGPQHGQGSYQGDTAAAPSATARALLAPAGLQRTAPAPAPTAASPTSRPALRPTLPPRVPVTGDVPAPWWAPAASVALPGSGQFALKQQRSVAYLVAEAFLLVQYLAAQRDGNRERQAYRALAVEVARKPFGGAQLGSWDYYERLEQFLESGAFDRVPGGDIDPETDPTTYNGARWLLARETYWRDPNVPPSAGSAEYQRALDFYRRSAVGDEFRWSWRDAQLQQDLYVQTIRSANRSYQRAVNMLGLVAMNHLASAIDAYVSVRIRRYGGVRVAGYGVEGVHLGVVPGTNGTPVWQTGVRFAP